jgi:hypothetical protein
MKAVLAILVVLATVLFLGCGSSDSTPSTSTPTNTVQAAGTATPTVTATLLPTATIPMPTATPPPPTSTTAPSPTPTSAPSPTPMSLTVGDSVTIGQMTFTVHGVRWGSSSFATPTPGQGYLMIDVAIVNNKSEAVNISSFLMFKLVDMDGRAQDWTVFGEPEGTLDGTLGPGRTMRGELGFDVDANQSSWELIIQPDLVETEQVIFMIPGP